MDKLEKPLQDLFDSLASDTTISKVNSATRLIQTQRIAMKILTGKT